MSGIPVFQISRYLSKGIYEKRNVEIQMNLLPEFEKNKLLEELYFRKTMYATQSVDCYLNGLINQKLADMVLDKANIDFKQLVSSLTDKQIQNICEYLQKVVVKVTNYRDFEFAQICTGGIPTSDIDVKTMESKMVSNVLFTGEILDVDGICGGYNLHFAWATGFIAGRSL